MSTSPHIIQPTLDDPRLDHFRQLKRSNLTRWSRRFIAEGEKVVERLLDSPIAIESILLSEKRSSLANRVRRETEIFILPHADCERLVGFEFHQGVMACGQRPPEPNLPNVLSEKLTTLAIAARMTDPDNLGTLLRLSTALGLDAVVLGPGSADPWSRRSLRVSMGAAFSIPIIESQNLAQTVEELSALEIQTIGTVLDPEAEPLMQATRPDRIALMFGNEATGLSATEVALCHRRVTIPMSPNADSLNVASAAAIFLYHFTRLTTTTTRS